MGFFIYDLIFLVLFVTFLVTFLYIRRKNLKREGVLYLYRTKWGVRLIDYIGKKYQKTLYVLGYVSIFIGYVLMVVMLYLLAKIIYIYVFFPQFVKTIKVPPIMPLIPYLPEVFKLDFLPPFYFTYWIIIIAIIAITHEFAHGIFARHFDINIKSTGFGFLGPFLAAFVELDEEKMAKKNKFSQLSILSAGTFANILTAIFFFFVMWIFFITTFMPAGVIFDTYSYSAVSLASISLVNNALIINPSYEKILSSLDETGTNTSIIRASNKNYIVTRSILEQQKPNETYIVLYDDAPAIKSELTGIITEFNGVKIQDREDLGRELIKYSPGEKIKITTKMQDNTNREVELVLEEHPEDKDKAWLGIGFYSKEGSGLFGKIYSWFSFFKQENTYYEAKINLAIFIYDLLWWIILISISVALVNMLPVGIFDGGRVFYLSVLMLLKSEDKTKKVFSIVTYLFLLIIVILMIFWAFSFR